MFAVLQSLRMQTTGLHFSVDLWFWMLQFLLL